MCDAYAVKQAFANLIEVFLPLPFTHRRATSVSDIKLSALLLLLFHSQEFRPESRRLPAVIVHLSGASALGRIQYQRGGKRPAGRGNGELLLQH